jgi:hypothetical protein
MHGMTNLSRLRKRLLEADGATSAGTANEIDIVGCATIAYSSEHSAHPVEHMLDGGSGPGATRWISACSDTVERIAAPASWDTNTQIPTRHDLRNAAPFAFSRKELGTCFDAMADG